MGNDVKRVRFIYSHREGEIYHVVPSAAHRWVYYPRMSVGECILFKVFDSAEDGRARFSLHASFKDTTEAADEPDRESVELRCMVLFGELPEDFAAQFVAPHLDPHSADQILSPDRVEVSAAMDSW